MGKQSKRKNKRRSGGGPRNNPTGPVAGPAAAGDAAAPSSPVDGIVGKIRHGDPRVRHAALVALAGTLYESTSLAQASRNKAQAAAGGGAGATKAARMAAEASNPALLRALAEKALDADVPCATTAVGCLSNYVSFYCGNGVHEVHDEVEVASDVMVPILLQRIQASLGTLRPLGTQVANASKDNVASSSKKGKDLAHTAVSAVDKLWASLEEQWSLLSLALSTLAGLIENFPLAVRRLGPNAFPQVLAVLQLTSDALQFTTRAGSREGGVPNQEGWEKKTGEAVSNAAANAARALHSLLDDNAALISSLPLGSTAAAGVAPAITTSVTSAIAQLTHTITNQQFSDATRLHAAGAVLSLRRVLVLEKELSNTATKASQEEQRLVLALQSCTNDVVVPVLHSLFDFTTTDAAETSSSFTAPKQLVARMMSLSQKLTTMKQDEQMESQIVEGVKARKEPARDIAKRQKKMKEERQQKKKELSQKQGISADDEMESEAMVEDHVRGEDEAKEMAGVASAMVVEEEEDRGENSHNNDKEDDGDEEAMKQDLDRVVQSWKDLVGSHKLALELVANLCASAGDDNADEDEMDGGTAYDDDERMWDSDDEARMLGAGGAPPAHARDTSHCTPCEQAAYDAVAAHRLPEQLLAVFRKWIEFTPSLNDAIDDAQRQDSDDMPPPTLVAEDVEEVLSTCALCLGNVVATSNLPTWSGSASATTSQGRVVENAAQCFWWELVSMLSSGDPRGGDAKSHHVTSVLLSLLRSRPGLRTAVDAPTLGRLVGLLQRPLKQGGPGAAQTNDNENIVQMHSQVISMLGALCSEEQQPHHSAEVDSLVCCALLERLRSATTENSNAGDDSGNQAASHSVVITHEILNVLMDMYGGDNCHEEVFEKEGVSDHFQRCLPGFKRRIKKVAAAGRAGGGVSREEAAVWSETALNASRFIKYKKG